MEKQSNNSRQTGSRPFQPSSVYDPVTPRPPRLPLQSSRGQHLSFSPIISFHQNWRTWLIPLYCLLILSLAFLGGTYLYEWSLNRTLSASEVPDLSDSIPIAAPGNTEFAVSNQGNDNLNAEEKAGYSVPNPLLPPINILLLGTDERDADAELSLTDTIILVTLNRQDNTVGMLSLPRDLWVRFAGYNMTSKINMAYAVGERRGYNGGGGQFAKDTISDFVGQPIQYYARINFRGFVEMVDLINGITIDVPRTIIDDEYPTADYGVETFYLQAGLQHLDGETALKYVRTRHSDDDYGRARRQQQVIRATMDKVLNADMIPLLVKEAPRLLTTMRSSVQTDIPLGKQFELANYVRANSIGEIKQLVLDSKYGREGYSEEGAWILLPDQDKVSDALDVFFNTASSNGNVTQPSQPSQPNSTADDAMVLVDPSLVRLEILNGTNEAGVAARISARLRKKGWNIMSIGDADRDDYETTLLVNYGLPDVLIQRIKDDLGIPSEPTKLPSIKVSAPVDMRIVVGLDILPSLDEPIAVSESK